METVAKQVYAIRVGTSLIELRSARTPPKAISSKLTRSIIATKRTFVPVGEWDGHWVAKGEKYSLIFKQTFYSGGTVIGYVQLHVFARRFGKYPKQDVMQVLSPTDSAKALNPKWRKANLER